MLKSKITKAEYDALDAALKPFYKLEGDSALLQSDEATELRAAKDREKVRADEAEAEARRLKDEKTAADNAAAEATRLANEEKARKAGDITALETSWQGKLDAAVKVEKDRADKLEGQLRVLLVDNAALAIANEISTDPDLIMPVITKRLKAELDGDTAITRVLDADGKPSAANIDDLKKELVANTKYARIMKGSNASGGGAGGQQNGGGAPSGDKKISDMTEAERVAAHKADPVAYKQRAKAEGLPVYG